jgi:hypothetical protein
MKKTLILLIVVALADSGCSHLTKSGRQQAAYARYVRRSSYARAKTQKKFSKRVKMPTPEMQMEPTIATSTGPQSVTAGEDSTSQ